MAICRTCHRETEGQDATCQQCGSDLTGWKQERTRAAQIDYPPRIQTFLVLVLVGLVAIFLLRPVNWTRVLVAVALSVVVAFVLYSVRYGLRQSRWLRQVQLRPGLSLLHWEIAVMLLAIGLGVTTATIGRAWAGEELTIVQKLVLYLLLASTCAGLTMSLTLAVVLSYVAGLDDRVPPPIFLDMNVLSDRVLEAAGKRLEVREWEILAVKRTQDGGLKIHVRQKMPKPKMSSTAGVAAPDSAPRSWIIEADRWARIRSILRSEDAA